MKIKLFTNLIKRYSKNTTSGLRSGFTIIEALVAIFILTISVSSMLGVTASSATSARYSNNEITANYLLQEAVDYIRNNRDTIAFQMKDASIGWGTFLNKYSPCFSNMCDIKIEDFNPADTTGVDVLSCPGSACESLYYDKDDALGGVTSFFYSHDKNFGELSNFVREVKMEKVDGSDDQIKVTATVRWKNGTSTKTQSLVVYLLNWQKD